MTPTTAPDAPEIDWDALREAARDAMSRAYALLPVPGRRGGPGRRRPHGHRVQRRERVVRDRAVRRVRAGLAAARHRRRAADPLHLCGRPGRGPRPLRPLPPAPVRVRGPRTRPGDTGRTAAAVRDAAAGVRPGPPRVTPVRPTAPVPRHERRPGAVGVPGPARVPVRPAPRQLRPLGVLRRAPARQPASPPARQAGRPGDLRLRPSVRFREPRAACGRWCPRGPDGVRPRPAPPARAAGGPAAGRPAPSAVRRVRRGSVRPTAGAPRRRGTAPRPSGSGRTRGRRCRRTRGRRRGPRRRPGRAAAR